MEYIIEILIAVFVFILAGYIFYRQFKEKKNGLCGNCSSCSATCPYYDDENLTECKGLTIIKKK